MMHAQSHRQIRVMVVAPHALTREGLRSLFASSLRAQLVADTGDAQHALTLCREHEPEVIVMFVEHMVPRASELAMRLRCMTGNPLIVAVASSGGNESVREMFEAGASAFLLQDCGFARIEEAVVSAAAGDVLIDLYASRETFESAAHAQPGPDSLSSRELQTLQLMSAGLSTKQIAQALHLSPKTIETYRAHIYSKLDIDSLVGLTKYAIMHGLASPQ